MSEFGRLYRTVGHWPEGATKNCSRLGREVELGLSKE